jgi:hypothetical protein
MELEQAKVGSLLTGGPGNYLILKKILKVKRVTKYVFDYYELRGKKQLYIVKNWMIEPEELSWSDEKIASSKSKRVFIKEVVFGNREKEID